MAQQRVVVNMKTFVAINVNDLDKFVNDFKLQNLDKRFVATQTCISFDSSGRITNFVANLFYETWLD